MTTTGFVQLLPGKHKCVPGKTVLTGTTLDGEAIKPIISYRCLLCYKKLHTPK